MIEASWVKNDNQKWYSLLEVVPVRAVPEGLNGVSVIFDQNMKVLLVGWGSLYHRISLAQIDGRLTDYPGEVFVTWTKLPEYAYQSVYWYLVDRYQPEFNYDRPAKFDIRNPVEVPF